MSKKICNIKCLKKNTDNNKAYCRICIIKYILNKMNIEFIDYYILFMY